MGRRWRARKKRTEERRDAKKQRDEQGGPRRDNRDKEVYHPMPQGNAKMEVYYALQGLHDTRWNATLEEFEACMTPEAKEEERNKWKTSLMSILPASFRIGTDVDPSVRQHLEQELEKFVGTEMEILVDPIGGRRNTDAPTDEQRQEGVAVKEEATLMTKRVAPAKRIPFIPHAYQLSLDRRTIRRNRGLQHFHDWLKANTGAGFVTRQETVSMLPPIVLGVEPHHAVLDMCAAPGSKTSQILEIVSQPSTPGDLEPRGCVVANDADPKRAYMLVFQLKRINSASHLVTSCNGQFLPMLKTPRDKQEGLFDRVLADVPCSGDGTARKNPGVWRHWSVLGSYGLHPLQLSIALNGARLCKVGGYIVYSTCAMNPIENEAVVAELLRATDGSLELVDKRRDLEGLVARPGWSTWRIICEAKSRKEIRNKQKKNNGKMKERRREWEAKEGNDVGKSGTELGVEATTGMDLNGTTDETNKSEESNKEYENQSELNSNEPLTWEEEALKCHAQKAGLIEYGSLEEVPENWRRRVRRSCFPPSPEEVERFSLNKCMRCLPQDMDTGGFFVALLRKVAPMSAKARAEAARLASELEEAKGEPNSKRARLDTDASQVATNTSLVQVDSEDNTTRTVESDTTNTGGIDVLAAHAAADQSASASASASVSLDHERTPGKPEHPSGRVKGKTRGEIQSENLIPVEDSLWEPLVEFYGLSNSFPRNQYMRRACGEAKVLYFVSKPIRALMERGIQDRVSIINTGLKGFERNSRDCTVRYRVTQEGVQFLVSHMTKRKLVASHDDFVTCLGDGGIPIESLSPALAESIRAFEQGSFVVILKGFEQHIFRKMILVMWRCRGEAINCLVAKVEKEGMISKLKALRKNQEADVSLSVGAS